jgi:hypothetical protein
MNSARMNSVHMNSTGGAGVDTGDERDTAIHKPAPQKMPKGGITKLLTWCMIYRRLRLSLSGLGG